MKCMDFERKVAVQNLEVDRLAVDIDSVLSKHVVTPEKKLASSIKYVHIMHNVVVVVVHKDQL